MPNNTHAKRLPLGFVQVLVLYRKHSGATVLRYEGMSIAGVFLIQRLEGSRFGIFELCVLNAGEHREGWETRESITGRGLK
jgi:hypothetical protein